MTSQTHDSALDAHSNRTGTRSVVPFLWITLALIAAALRLADLAAAPLSAAEATQALSAYRAAQAIDVSRAAPPSGGYSTILFHANVLLFALFQGGDWLARLVPALAGTGLVLTPLLLRRHLGQWGALGMALMLAISPTTLLLSRTLDGAIVAALGVMLLLGCLLRFLDFRHPRLVTLAGIGLAVAFTAGSAAWGMLAGLALAIAGVLWAMWDRSKWVWAIASPAAGRFLVALGLGVLGLGAGMGLNLPGLAVAGGHFFTWPTSFRSVTGALTPAPFSLLLIYEPLILLFGLAGLALTARRRHTVGFLFALWATFGGMQLALVRGQQPADHLWVLVPLAGLAGIAVQELVRSLRVHGHWLNEGLHLPIALTLWAHWGLVLARYARLGNPADQILAGLTLILQVLLIGAFGFAVSAPEQGEKPAQAARRGLAAALRAGGLSGGLALLLLTFSIAWGLTHRRPADPREPAVINPSAIEVRTLVEVVEQVSILNTGIDIGLPVTFVGEPDPVLTWSLRQYDQQIVHRLEPGAQPPIVIAPIQSLPDGYFGEAFTLRRTWTPTESGREMLKWLLYRDTAIPPVVTEQVVLWVREDLGTASQ